ncbi:integumentary mucin C.1 [Drosophila madeirensis]|uniref:Integumentary mucin C.1 n=1 Tax=Drosophila madeirensis TaxID=30013 RepID=A0AAU9G2T5_DROMD
MQQHQKREAIHRIMALGILLLALNLKAVAASRPFSLGNWRFNDLHYSSAQYAKILADSGIGHDQDPTEKGARAGEGGGRSLQIQYVDYQPQCASGGVPVCATNGTDHFYFENDCRLEAHNMKMLFQYGTELEPTELERCQPTCRSMKCTKVQRPVCAVAEMGAEGSGAQTPTTFPNECEVRQHECQSRQAMRILHAGPCPAPTTKGRRKKKSRRNKGKRPATATATGSTGRPKVYVMLAEPSSKTSTTTTTTTTETPQMMPIASSTVSPLRFRQMMNSGNPMVSVSRAMDAYSVYNIDDVGHDYGEITDSTLSMFVPGVGRVTDAYPTTTTTTTTPKTGTLKPMPMAVISTTTAAPMVWTSSSTTTTSTEMPWMSTETSSPAATTETADSQGEDTTTAISATDRTEPL